MLTILAAPGRFQCLGYVAQKGFTMSEVASRTETVELEELRDAIRAEYGAVAIDPEEEWMAAPLAWAQVN